MGSYLSCIQLKKKLFANYDHSGHLEDNVNRKLSQRVRRLNTITNLSIAVD